MGLYSENIDYKNKSYWLIVISTMFLYFIGKHEGMQIILEALSNAGI